MHEILFRGFHPDENGKEKVFVNGKWIKGFWVFGNLFVSDYKPEWQILIGSSTIMVHQNVIPETVGQYTGLTDKNGKPIFEGDIIYFRKSRKSVYFDTSLRIPCFTTGIGFGSSTGKHPYVISDRCEIIGNVHSNPKLLEVCGNE